MALCSFNPSTFLSINASGWTQLALCAGITLLITKPVGIYLFQVLDGKNTFLEPVLGPVERLTYRLLRVDPRREQSWRQYVAVTLLFSLVTMVLLTRGALTTFSIANDVAKYFAIIPAILVPFVGIKAIDLLVSGLHLV